MLYMAIILLATLKIRKPDLLQDRDKGVRSRYYSVIIPFRNEIENLKMIYFDLTNLKFDQSKIEIIFIDDHSSDGSFEWLDKCKFPDNFKLLSSSMIGKKQALIKAIASAKGNYIITTDADCRLNPLWIKNIDETIESENPNLLVQPVITNFSNKLIYQFQYFDSLSLLGINLALCNFQGYPSIASGANLVFKKEYFDRIQPFRNNMQITSGDDMFLLRSFVKQNPNSIVLNYNPENLVITKSESSWIGLISQRMRWVGKMKRFNNSSSFSLGLLSMAAQIILLGLLLGVWYQNLFIFVFIFFWLFKSVIDYVFLRRIAKQIDQNVRWFNVFILEPIYMIFVPLIVVSSILYSPKWKERKINN